MTEPPARVLYEYLRELGVIGSPAGETPWAAGIGPLPPDGDQYVAVVDAGGRQEGRVLGTGDRVIHPRVTIIVRGTDYPTAWRKGAEIQTALDKIGVSLARGGNGQALPVMVDGLNFVLWAAHVRSPLMPIGREPDTGRQIFTATAELTIESSTPDSFTGVYEERTPVPSDTFLGYHDGYLYRFPMSGILDAALPVGSGTLVRDGSGNYHWQTGGAGDLSYKHTQGSPAAVWDIVHNLGRSVNVTVYNSAGDEVIGSVREVSVSEVTVTFSGAMSGTAICS